MESCSGLPCTPLRTPEPRLLACLVDDSRAETGHAGRKKLGDATTCVNYLEFWRRDLLAQSTSSDVAELLDSLVASTSRLEPTLHVLRLSDLLLEMVHKGLGLYRETVDVHRVSAWLRTCAGAAERRASNPPQPLLGIRVWLERHPEVQKQVILEGLEACQRGDDVGHADFKNRKRLVGAKLPTDFGPWCLVQAVRLAGSKLGVAKHLFLEAYRALETPDGGEGLLLEVLPEQARGHALLPPARSWGLWHDGSRSVQ